MHCVACDCVSGFIDFFGGGGGALTFNVSRQMAPASNPHELWETL